MEVAMRRVGHSSEMHSGKSGHLTEATETARPFRRRHCCSARNTISAQAFKTRQRKREAE